MKISIQGNLGSYSHIAANSIFRKSSVPDGRQVNSAQNDKLELLERAEFTEVFEDLKDNRADYIVIPIENSTHGSVYQNYDNISKYGFTIIGEVYLRINFHLIVHPGAKLEDITTIYSHPVGLNQIREFLRTHKNIKDIEFEDTAGSVKMIKEKGLKDSAAAASRLAAEIYGMEILEENIHENQKNFTRFFVLSNGTTTALPFNKGEVSALVDGGVSKNNKTSIQFQLGDEPGSLYKSLRCFADRDIALTKIESRPILHTDWEYRFYVDVMSGIQEDKMKNALFELKSYVKELKILGSYKKGEYIET